MHQRGKVTVKRGLGDILGRRGYPRPVSGIVPAGAGISPALGGGCPALPLAFSARWLVSHIAGDVPHPAGKIISPGVPGASPIIGSPKGYIYYALLDP